MPTWNRESTGITGLEEDVKAVYTWVENKLAAQTTWVLGEIGRVTAKMATYEQAANDAIAVMQSLSDQLKSALSNSDSAAKDAAVQAVADRLENAAQSFTAAVQTDAPSPGPDAGNSDAPADVPSTDTPVAPAGTDTPVDPNAPSA